MKSDAPLLDLERVSGTRTWSALSIGDCYSHTLFLDSGAFGLYNEHVLGRGEKKMGKHGKELDQAHVKFSQGNYDFYSLKPGSEFRAYCDRYAAFVKKVPDNVGFLFANVDAIANPKRTWEVQQYFEKEHGIQPVPIVHYGSSLRDLERYLETGRYRLLGMGGLGHGTPTHQYLRWADMVYRHICPASNGHKPTIRTHGFAMTSWKLICRWPWWSVDSATWVKLAAFGWVLVPAWSDRHGWRYDVPPHQLNMSRKPTDRRTKFWWRARVRSPREIRHRHVDNCSQWVKETADRWLRHLSVEMGDYDDEGKVVSYGVSTDCSVRAMVNLYYLKQLELSRPKWPSPLSPAIVNGKNRFAGGFGL